LGDPSPDRANSARGEAVSWIGFYELAGPYNDHGAEPGQAMVLGPHRDTPACSPIGLHGACGQSFLSAETLVVRDVAALGDGYVACDPRDLAELVIPMIGESGKPWGVLDADSFAAGTFTERDADVLTAFSVAAGISEPVRRVVRVFG
jgi:putative methionine-R-sulfoxide reductase with GAF domain